MTADAEQTVLLRKIEKNTREQPHKPQHACPNCGYCPHCGRGGYRPYPYQPWINPSPWYPPIYVGDPPPWYQTTTTWTVSNSGSVAAGSFTDPCMAAIN